MKTLLIVRFSSFGDIVQCLSVTKAAKETGEYSKVYWVTKEEFRSLVQSSESVDQVFSLPKTGKLRDLFQLALSLKGTSFDVLYDAHQNVRSRIFQFFIYLTHAKRFSIRRIRRKKERIKRWLLFKWRINLLPNPYRGMISYLSPLKLCLEDLTQSLNFLSDEDFLSLKRREPILEKDYICIAPSAAWPMKTWPIGHWEKLLELAKNYQVIILGGPRDQFCQDLAKHFPHAHNLAGQLSLMESCEVVKRAKCLVSADTGLMHVGDLTGTKTLALIGPTAFGFPTHPHVKTLSVDLPCRPCTKDGRGKCSRKIYQECMVQIAPERVFAELEKISEQ